MANPWDQQSKESSRAFSAFVAYRDLGLRRSCNAVAMQLNINASSVLELSKRHHWQERVRAWDTHVDEQTQKDQIEAVKIMKKRQIALVLKAQKAAEKGLCKLIKQLADDKASPYAMKPDGLSKLLDTGCRLERLNRDEPEQNVEFVQQSRFDNLTLEELETYRNLVAKAEGER
jgi:hypothetical protein